MSKVILKPGNLPLVKDSSSSLGTGEKRNGDNMKKTLKQILAMSMAATLTLGFVGCGAKDSNKGSKNDSSAEVAAQSTTYPYEYTDKEGATVTFEKAPEKIVSVAPNMTELVYALDCGDRLVGRTDYCDYPEEAKSVESIGTLMTPNMEKIVELDPDVVLTSTHFEEENAKKLKELNIPELALYAENDMNGVYDMITTLGTVLDKQEKAGELVDDMKSTISDVEAKVKDLKAPTVYYVVGYGEGGDYTATGDTFVNGLITAAGGDNIAKDGTGWSYSLEKLVEADPEYIIVRPGEKDTFCSTEGYKDLTAVKEDRVVEFDNNLFDRQGYRNAQGVKALAEIFHPEAFSDAK